MKYKLYLDGVWYRDANGNTCCYKLTTSRNSKLAAETYGRDATITNMHGKVVSKARLDESGKAYNVVFDKEEMIQ